MKHLTSGPTPRDLGFAMPPEWAPHAATWTSWPFDDALWFGRLEGVRREFAELVRTISRFEPVHLLVRDEEAEADAKSRLAGADVTQYPITLHRVPLDDVWFRDNGPLFVKRGGDLSFVNWEFNAWGGKFRWANDTRAPEAVADILNVAHWDVPLVMEGGSLEQNGAGVALTTRSCLPGEARNPGLGEKQLADMLREYLGIEKLLWLDGGLEGDHTDGHIDTITRFVNPGTIVTAIEEDEDDPNYAPMKANLERLRTFTDLAGQPFEIVPLPLPANRLEGEEGRLPPTYANFYVGNGFAVVPIYGDPNDEKALTILRGLFPGREVIGLMSRELITGGGSFHCVTQQQPTGLIWKGEEVAAS